MLHRKEEDGSPTAPYSDGPIEILPNVWLGAEDNARDWRRLAARNIGSILNVAKEVSSPFDSLTQSDLVQRGFPEAMAFVDQSLARGEGVLIQYVHCNSIVLTEP